MHIRRVEKPVSENDYAPSASQVLGGKKKTKTAIHTMVGVRLSALVHIIPWSVAILLEVERRILELHGVVIAWVGVGGRCGVEG